MASLPVFWPYLRRNIDRILITHEIEVKVTEHFTQIDDQVNEGRLESGEDKGRQPRDQKYTPWADGKKRGSMDLGYNTSVVMMRDLDRNGTGGSETPGEDMGLPFDGSRRHDPGHGQSRMHYLSRASKEGLLAR